MPRAKITEAEKLAEKVDMLNKAGLTLPLIINSDKLFSTMKSLGYSRYKIVVYLLGLTHTAGRRMDLGNTHEIKIDEQLNVFTRKITTTGK